jgi:uncharacterized membrane protein
MSKFIVVIVPDETKAYEGSRALRELHAEGSLTLYGMAIVAKAANGNLSVKQSVDEGPLGTAVGSLTGGLIGLLGGPVGAAIGLGAGAWLGMLRDLTHLGVGGDFLDKVSHELTPGRVAIVAEISEDWVTPLDTRMSVLGGTVVRTWRADFEDQMIREEVAASKAELAQLQAEYQQATAENKAKLKARIDEVQAKAKAASDRLQVRVKQIEQETDARIKALQEQAAKAKGDAKAKFDTRIAELRADGERRSRQLKEAWGLTKAALTP